jgi:hypothetical protein
MEIGVILLFWFLALLAVSSKDLKGLFYLFFCSMSFGSFAVVPPELTGGLSLTATPIVAMLIIFRTLYTIEGRSFFVNCHTIKPLNWLFYFWVIAVLVTIFSPRLFSSEVLVIPVRDTPFMKAEFLQPSAQNFSQITYLTISVFSVFAFAFLLQQSENRTHALKGIFWGGVTVIITGFLDLSSQYISMDFLLTPFRNATYTLLIEAQVLGSKRITGLMPEASSFGGLSIAFLSITYFLKGIYLHSAFKPFVYINIGLLLIMVWLSTSSAAYVALGVFILLVLIEIAWRAAVSTRKRLFQPSVLPDVVAILLIIIGLLLLYLLAPEVFDPLYELFNIMVLKKNESDSFMERSFWTEVSWQALIDSWGIGVGAGGTRASNGAVALISNVGVISALFYFGFVFKTFISNAKSSFGELIISAFRWSFLPSFVTWILVGVTSDFGLYFAFLYGLVYGFTAKN